MEGWSAGEHCELHQPVAAVSAAVLSTCEVVGLLSLSQNEFEAASAPLRHTCHQLSSVEAAVLEIVSVLHQVHVVRKGGGVGRIIPEN